MQAIVIIFKFEINLMIVVDQSSKSSLVAEEALGNVRTVRAFASEELEIKSGPLSVNLLVINSLIFN